MAFRRNVKIMQLKTSTLLSFIAVGLLNTTGIPAAIANSAPVATNDPVLVRGKDVQIRRSDFENEKKNVPPDQRGALSTNIDQIKKVLERMTQQSALLKQLSAEGFDKKPEIQAELEYAKRQKLLSLYAVELSARVKVPDMEMAARERYQTSQKQLTEPEKISAYHIIVTTQKRSRAEAIARVEEARKRALAGEDFVKLVREYTEDPSARRNDGYLGFFPKEQMDPAFAKAAFAMTKKGEISEVVESQFGFHVIQFQDRVPGRVTPYEEIRAQFIEDAERNYREFEVRKLLNQLLIDQAPEANMDEIQKLIDKDALEIRRNLNEKIRQEILESQQKKKQ